MRLQVRIKQFEVLASFWDCKVPPRLVAIEEEMVTRSLLDCKRHEVQRRLLSTRVTEADSSEVPSFI